MIDGWAVEMKVSAENWTLRGASCFGEPLPPNFDQTLNPHFSVEHDRWTLKH